ncbi:MAG: hypothetical protein H8E87_06055, partial [FCB group bacterium]|nr:hypothetical protein [FCB group bacterium]
MKKLFIALTAVMLLSISVQAQPPDTLWTHTYGGDGQDYAYCVQQTSVCREVLANRQDSLNGIWNELQITGSLPYSRGWHTAIYDSQNERMIIFGGWSGVVYNSLNDVWSYNIAANTWTQISTTGGPTPNRAGHVAIYDNIRHRMVVFAGGNWWTTWYNDTWALDLTTNTWTQLSTTGGPPTNRL